jgi:hypothetical protein
MPKMEAIFGTGGEAGGRLRGQPFQELAAMENPAHIIRQHFYRTPLGCHRLYR